VSPLGRPIRDVLDAGTTENEIQSVWRRIQEQRRKRVALRPALLAAALAMVAVLAAFFVLRAPSRGAVPREPAGPLALVAGTAEHPLAGGDDIANTTNLSDGSRVALDSGAHLSIIENSGRTFVTHLSSGRADFSVKPGGPRRWVVECGLATIEVVGTEFTVARSTADLRVEVRHGVVVVRGEDVPDHVRRVVAGESLRLTSPAGAANVEASSDAVAVNAAPPSIAAAPATPNVTSPSIATASAVPNVASPSIATGAAPNVASPSIATGAVPNVASPSIATGAVPAAVGASIATTSGTHGTNAEVAALYERADAARRSGHARDAAVLLKSAIARDPHGQRAAIAYFTLGRLYLDLGDAGPAAGALERSLKAGAPRSLEEDVRARLVEARAKMGDLAGARRAAGEYRARFPGGRRTADVDRWSGE